jgi:hypothetical protein
MARPPLFTLKATHLHGVQALITLCTRLQHTIVMTIVVRYADITYVINRIRSIQIESVLSIEDEYLIDRLENLVYFPIRYYSSSRIENTKVKLPAE